MKNPTDTNVMNNPNHGESRKENQMSTIIRTASATILVTLGLALAAEAAEPPKLEAPADWDKLVGQPVDLAPWSYIWRADRQVQEKPEAYFIPRILKRQDEVYRKIPLPVPPVPGYPAPGAGQIERWIVGPMPPAPTGQLALGLLWIGPVAAIKVELNWPGAIPPVEGVEVRVYPRKANLGWFGTGPDEVLARSMISSDGRTWTYLIDHTGDGPAFPSPEVRAAQDRQWQTLNEAAPLPKSRDWLPVFSRTSPWCVDMVCVFVSADAAAKMPGGKLPVPEIRLFTPRVWNTATVKWVRTDVAVEWVKPSPAQNPELRFEGFMTKTGTAMPLPPGDANTPRRGVLVPVLHAYGSHLTLRFGQTGCSIRVSDLVAGPIYIPEHGLVISRASDKVQGKQFLEDLAKKNLKSLSQMVREKPEPSYRELLLKWRPTLDPVQIQPFGTDRKTGAKGVSEVPGVMQAEIPDELLMQAWRSATGQLYANGPGQYWNLGYESGRATHAADLCGLFDKTDGVYDHFLASPGEKQCGDFSDGKGSLEWSKLAYDIGCTWQGTHPGTGLLLGAMSQKSMLTADRAWFDKRRERLTAAADWIIRQRDLYLKDVPNRAELAVAGQHPPCALGDKVLGGSAWWFYHVMDAHNVQGLEYFAQALSRVAPEAAKKYAAEADRYRQDMLKTLRRQAIFSPVRKGLDGTYRSYIPIAAYTHGLTIRESGMFQYEVGDVTAAVDIARDGSIFPPNDPLIDGIVTFVEEGLALGPDPSKGDKWFWHINSGLDKDSYNAHVYLLRDDVPGFLRWWHSLGAAYVEPEKGRWMEGRIKGDTDGATAGWFAELFRKSLVMEQGDALWLARATPRAYLEQGKKVSVKNAPTYFGTVVYEIISDVDNGKITATVGMPSRKAPKEVVLRFRHPKSAPIKNVTVNGPSTGSGQGKPWTEFNKDKETITLKGLAGTVAVTAQY